ncbi:DDB1- and CUL4-associated factor 5-like [Physella acuta]|uniref:DDB1- and CUL4-associated factor 5-like n=1 Tax=Physella acuta TaxID=109671 RepID=UPI0027DE33E2|nr:DDB1- and CUL4-associated factor 5-like [Physella acuta]
MDMKRNHFIPTPLGLRERERQGLSLTNSKQILFGHRTALSQSLFKTDLRGHFGCVNAIEYSSDGELIASGGDDRRLLIWNVAQTIFNKKKPTVIDTLHISNINSCCFDVDNKKVATGGNDGQVIVHDFNVCQSTAVYGLSDAIYCLSPDPVNSTILATASDDGKALILDTRLPVDNGPFVLANQDSAMHSIMFNPLDPRLLATANSKHGIGLWDIRMPLKSLNYKSNVLNCMSVRFNSRGDRLLSLRRRASPILYDIGKMHPIYEFDFETYYNACTLKSCSFAGLHDEYVMSGSDDFCIYLWKIPTNLSEGYIQCHPHMVLKGHRSIVNQVRYCPHNQFIISSGVEKLIKLWSPFSVPNCTGELVQQAGHVTEVERNAYSHEEYIHMVLQAGSFLSHDYSHGSTEEEPCMIAFFDSLIQREIEQNIDSDDDITNSSDDNNNSPSDAGGGAAADPRVGPEPSSSLPDVVADTPVSLEGEDASSTRDTVGSASSRLEESSRPLYMDLDTSSDSDSEVDEILSAMYSRYMTSREKALNSGSQPSGKKISSVIAKGKQKTYALKRAAYPKKLERIREYLQHSGDQYLRDNATNMNILVDVIENFVDNLVASDSSSNSRALSDTNDGHMSADLAHNNLSEAQEEVAQQTITLETPPSPPSAQTSQNRRNIPLALDSGLYFMPELQAFAPDNFNTVINIDQSSRGHGNQAAASNSSPLSSPGSSSVNTKRKSSCTEASQKLSPRASCSKTETNSAQSQTPSNPFASVTLDRSNSDASFRAFIRKNNSKCASGSKDSEPRCSRSNGAHTTGSEASCSVRSKLCMNSAQVTSHPAQTSELSRGDCTPTHQAVGSSLATAGPSINNPPTDSCSPSKESNSNGKVQFKKAKLKGRKFRLHRSNSSSSEDG